jgi:hypothetical protein
MPRSMYLNRLCNGADPSVEGRTGANTRERVNRGSDQAGNPDDRATLPRRGAEISRLTLRRLGDRLVISDEG